jgi:general secretion pathway protein G
MKKNALKLALLGSGILLLLIAAFLVLPMFMSCHGCSSGGEVSRATSDVDLLKTQLNTYEMATGSLPPATVGLEALVRNPGAPRWRQLMTEVPLDPWGLPYVYQEPAVRSGERYDLFSRGPDKLEGTADDIGNWPLPSSTDS